MNTVDYHKIITIEPDQRSGKPCIRGTRMTVTDVLEYLASGMTDDELGDFLEAEKHAMRAERVIWIRDGKIDHERAARLKKKQNDPGDDSPMSEPEQPETDSHAAASSGRIG